MPEKYFVADPAAADKLAAEAQARLAECLERVAASLLDAAKRVADGKPHGLRSSADRRDPEDALREFTCLAAAWAPQQLCELLDLCQSAIAAYGPEGNTYYPAPNTTRAIDPDLVAAMRRLVGPLGDVAFKPGDLVAWDDPEDEDAYFTGSVLATDRNLAVMRDVTRRARSRYETSRVDGLPAVPIAQLRQTRR